MSRNVFRQFIDLLPARPLQVGTVTATDGDVSTVELPGGGVLRARGSEPLGVKVFVRDGVIEGAAPSLLIEVIEI